MNERLGEAQADEEGDFTREFRLLPDLQRGSYQIRATGKESATTQITVTGGPAGTGKGEEAGAMGKEPQIEHRPLGQAILLVGFFGVLAAAGLFSARMA